MPTGVPALPCVRYQRVLGGDNRMLSIPLNLTICGPIHGFHAPSGAAHIATTGDQ